MGRRNNGRDMADVVLFTTLVLLLIVMVFFALGYLVGAWII